MCLSPQRLIRFALAFLAFAAPTRAQSIQEVEPAVREARRILLEASHLISEIPEMQRPSAVANIASQLTRAGDLPQALAVSHLLEKPGERALTTQCITWQLAHSGNFAQALALIDESPDDQSRASLYQQLALLYVEKDDYAQALPMARRIRNNPDLLADTLIRIAIPRAKSGELVGARQIFDEALHVIAEATQQDALHAAMFMHLASAQKEVGDTSDAYATLDRLYAMAQSPEVLNRAMLLESLAIAQAQLGDITDALRTIDENSSVNSNVVLMIISEEQAKHGLFSDALETAARIADPGTKTAAMRELTMIRGTHGTLNDSLPALEQIPQLADRAEAMATLALEQAENDNPAASQTLLALSRLSSKNGEKQRPLPDVVLGIIAVTRGVLGDMAGAQQVVLTIREPESRVWPLWNIASFMAERGHAQDALPLADFQNEAHPKSYALLGTAQGILERLAEEEKTRAAKQ